MTTSSAPDAERGALIALARELLARDGWSAEQVRATQAEAVRRLVRHAVGASDYWREALGADAGLGPVVLTELPTLSRRTLMAEFDRAVTDPRLRLADVEAHLAGPARELYHDEYRVLTTSGTTGERGVFVYGRADFARWIAASLRAVLRMGLAPGMRVVGIGAPDPIHLSRQIFAAFEAAGGDGAPRLAVTSTADELVTSLNAFQPEAITTYPTVASLLADEQLRGRLRIAPRVVAVGSEVLTEETRERIAAAWGIGPFEVYAATEAPLIASSARPGGGLAISEDLLVVEVVDESGRAVGPGVPGHRVLVTNLASHAQPLIRYELEDSVVLARDPDASGLPYRRIERVDGRTDEILRLPAAGDGEVAVHPHALRAPFARLQEVRQYQLVRHPDALEARVVLDPQAGGEAMERVAAGLRRALRQAGAAPLRVDVRAVEAIERRPGPGAKTTLVTVAA